MTMAIFTEFSRGMDALIGVQKLKHFVVCG
jgi:hypothetical protein